jgi:hypothetical protein
MEDLDRQGQELGHRALFMQRGGDGLLSFMGLR